MSLQYFVEMRSPLLNAERSQYTELLKTCNRNAEHLTVLTSSFHKMTVWHRFMTVPHRHCEFLLLQLQISIVQLRHHNTSATSFSEYLCKIMLLYVRANKLKICSREPSKIIGSVATISQQPGQFDLLISISAISGFRST